jgi:hypothetical protein
MTAESTDKGLSAIEIREEGTVFFYCAHCTTHTLAMHKLAIIDHGQDEWVCGRHKRILDAPKVVTHRDWALFQEAERAFQPIREVRAGKEIQIGEDQIYLAIGFAAGIHDVVDILAEGDEAIGKAMRLRLGFQSYHGIQAPDIKVKRMLLAFGYNAGLDVGISAWLQ